MRKAVIAGVMMAAGLGAAPASAQLIGPEAQPLPRQADLILTNGRIYTPAGWVGAMAIGRGVILELGDEAALKPLRTARTKVIDLKGQTVLPGLHDMHVHPTGSGIAAMQCELPQGSSRQVILDITAGCAKAKKPGQWVTGRAYEPATFDTPPHKSMLDAVAPNNPVIFTDISGHSSWANTAALKIAGITRDTPNPPNGIIEKDANGEPTGVLRESAGGLVSTHIPAATRAETARALKWAVDTILSQGITSIDDAGVSEDAAQAYADLYDRGQMKLRVRGCLIYTAAGLISRRETYARDRFSPSCVKIVLDGVPTDSHTAYMLDDYLPLEGRSEAGRTRGLTFVQPDDLNILVTRFDTMGMTVKMHAAGDAAVREGLDAIAAARKANGFSGVLHDVGHNSFIHMDDIRRARSIGAVFEFSPYIWFDSPIVQGIKKAIGPERMKRWIPIKDALDGGAFSVIGSDWAVVPSVNPWIALETLVTRRPPGGQGEPVGEQEAITLKQAIDLYTIASARQQYDAHRRGSIERGKLADVVVIDRNIFEVPITTVHDTKVKMTIINGEVVYDGRPVPPRP